MVWKNFIFTVWTLLKDFRFSVLIKCVTFTIARLIFKSITLDNYESFLFGHHLILSKWCLHICLLQGPANPDHVENGSGSSARGEYNKIKSVVHKRISWFLKENLYFLQYISWTYVSSNIAHILKNLCDSSVQINIPGVDKIYPEWVKYSRDDWTILCWNFCRVKYSRVNKLSCPFRKQNIINQTSFFF